ncbi:hypothetical protein ACOME3_009284 [Neoechinorhynchus agilis]
MTDNSTDTTHDDDLLADSETYVHYKPYLRMIMRKANMTQIADILSTNYMIVGGHHEALAAFFNEVKHINFRDFPQLNFKDIDTGFEYVKRRSDVCRLIRQAKSSQARELIDLYWDLLVQRSIQLRFIIRIQEFLDRTIVENYDYQEALQFARTYLTEFVLGNRERDVMVCKAMSILAYKNQRDCPFIELTSQIRRDEAAKMVSFLLMQETERLAVKDLTGRDHVQSEEIPDSKLLAAYMASYKLVSLTGLVEKVQREIKEPSFIRIDGYREFNIRGILTPDVEQEIRRGRLTNQ